MKSNTVIRTVIALLLCVLLPLQAGATLARATAMARHGSAGTTAAAMAAEAARSGQPAMHAGHHGHGSAPYHAEPVHHGAHGAHGAADAQATAAHGQPDQARAATHQSVHAKAGCADCAKCCLQAASAPPPVLVADFAPALARAAFLPQSAPAPAFLTDGPERPPRHLIA